MEATCKEKDDLVCVNELMNMMGEFDRVEHEVRESRYLDFVIDFLRVFAIDLCLAGSEVKVPF